MGETSYQSAREVNHRAAEPFGVVRHIHCTLDAGFLVLFLVEAIIAKSRFDGLIGGWRGHMILTVVALALLLVRGVWKRTREPFSFAPPRNVSIVLAIAFAWAIISCIVQPNAYANLVFLGAFAANIYVCLYIAPNLVLPYLGERGVLLYALPLFAVTILNLVYGVAAPAKALHEGRLAGILHNATHAGALSAIASILALWMVLQWNRHKKAWLVFCVVGVVMLVMTRTRAALGGWAVGSVAMLAYWARWQQAAHLKRYIALVLVAALMLIGLAVIGNPDLISRSRDHLRANREELFQTRMTHWKYGIANAVMHPIFGEGPMAKFGNTNDPTVNTYVREESYCNTWLTFAQAYGIPGSLLFALVCFEIVRIAVKGQVTLPLLLLGLMSWGVVASIAHMWVVSFGTPSDRATWLIMGLALAARSSYGRGELLVVEHRRGNVGRL